MSLSWTRLRRRGWCGCARKNERCEPFEILSYLNGARLDANHPMSIALDGQAVNITLETRADSLDFGLVGRRRAVPHLQRLLGQSGKRPQRSGVRGRDLMSIPADERALRR